jgi:hypothetical protein
MARLSHGLSDPASLTNHCRSKKSRPKARLLYRSDLTMDELMRLVEQIGTARVMFAIDRLMQPTLPFIAAE